MDRVDGLDRLDELAGLERFRGDRRAPHARRPKACSTPRPWRHLRPSSYLINIGRGAIVVLDDLVAALRHGSLAGAALDVFEVEPLAAGSPALGLPQRDPHAAHRRLIRRSSPSGTWRLLVENVGRFRSERIPLLNVVDKTLWF